MTTFKLWVFKFPMILIALFTNTSICNSQNKNTIAFDWPSGKALALGYGFDLENPDGPFDSPFTSEIAIDSTVDPSEVEIEYYFTDRAARYLSATNEKLKLGLGFWIFSASYDQLFNARQESSSEDIVLIAKRKKTHRTYFIKDLKKQKDAFVIDKSDPVYGKGFISSFTTGSAISATIVIHSDNWSNKSRIEKIINSKVDAGGLINASAYYEIEKELNSSGSKVTTSITLNVKGSKKSTEENFPSLENFSFKEINKYLNEQGTIDNSPISASFTYYDKSEPTVDETLAMILFDNYYQIRTDIDNAYKLKALLAAHPKIKSSLVDSVLNILMQSSDALQDYYESMKGKKHQLPPSFATSQDILKNSKLEVELFSVNPNISKGRASKDSIISNALHLQDIHNINERLIFKVKGPFLKDVQFFYGIPGENSKAEQFFLTPGEPYRGSRFSGNMTCSWTLINDRPDNTPVNRDLYSLMNSHRTEMQEYCGVESNTKASKKREIFARVTDCFGRSEDFVLVTITWFCGDVNSVTGGRNNLVHTQYDLHDY